MAFQINARTLYRHIPFLSIEESSQPTPGGSGVSLVSPTRSHRNPVHWDNNKLCDFASSKSPALSALIHKTGMSGEIVLEFGEEIALELTRVEGKLAQDLCLDAPSALQLQMEFSNLAEELHKRVARRPPAKSSPGWPSLERIFPCLAPLRKHFDIIPEPSSPEHEGPDPTVDDIHETDIDDDNNEDPDDDDDIASNRSVGIQTSPLMDSKSISSTETDRAQSSVHVEDSIQETSDLHEFHNTGLPIHSFQEAGLPIHLFQETSDIHNTGLPIHQHSFNETFDIPNPTLAINSHIPILLFLSNFLVDYSSSAEGSDSEGLDTPINNYSAMLDLVGEYGSDGMDDNDTEPEERTYPEPPGRTNPGRPERANPEPPSKSPAVVKSDEFQRKCVDEVPRRDPVGSSDLASTHQQPKQGAGKSQRVNQSRARK